MGLRSFVKKAAKKGIGAAEDAGGAARSVAERGAGAVSGYAGRLKTNIEADLANPNSEGYKFAHAPLGQYYLPKPIQKVAGFLAPTPSEAVNANKAAIQHPSPGRILNAGLTDLQIATLPGIASAAARAPRAAQAASRAIAVRGGLRTALASESGAIGGIAAKKTATQVAERTAARTERVAGKIATERVASVGLADEAADVAKASRLRTMPDNVLAEMKTPAAKLEKVRRLEARPGAPGGGTKAVTSPEAIARAGIEPGRAPRSRIAGATTTANRPAATRAPLAERLGVSSKPSTVAERAVKGAKPAISEAPVAPVSAAQAETLNATKPATEAVAKRGIGGLRSAKTEAVEAAPKATKATPRGSNPNYTTKNGKVTTKTFTQTQDAEILKALRQADQPAGGMGVHPGTGQPVSLTSRGSIARRGGSIAGQPRGAAVKRVAGQEFEDALAAAGETTKPATVAARTQPAAAPAAKVATTTEKVATKAKVATKVAPAAKTKPAAGAALSTTAEVPEAAVKRSVLRRVAGRTLKTAKTAATIGIPLAAGGSLIMQSRGSAPAGEQPIANTTPTVPSAHYPSEAELGLQAVAKVFKERGQRGINALTSGLTTVTANTKGKKLSKNQSDTYLREAVRRAFLDNK